MQTRPITVAETHMFRRQADKIWSDAELTVLVYHLALNPEDWPRRR
jgi:hypothetical protein